MPKRLRPLVFFICFGAVDCVIGLIYVLLRASDVGILKTISTIMSLIALGTSIAYSIRGYQKKDNRLFRICFISYALSELFLCGTYVHSRLLPEIGVMAKTLTFCSIMFVGFSLNLGKIKSYIFAGLNLAIELVLLFISYRMLPVIYTEQNLQNTITLIENASQFILASITMMMVFAKYTDKKFRHSKSL